MKPYYDHGGVTLYLGDCREVLPALDMQPSCVIADPPYGETALAWDRWPAGWVDAITAPTMWVFGSFRMFMARRDDFADWRLAQEVIWRKHNGTGPLADRFRRVHELVVQFYRGSWKDLYKEPQYTRDATARTVRRKQKPTHWSKMKEGHFTSIDGGPRLMRSVLDIRSEHGRAVHPTQKPVALVSPLLAYACPPGGLVVDPFLGSGTTAVAARAIGRRCIGVEGREAYLEAAVRRLEQEVLTLGGVA